MALEELFASEGPLAQEAARYESRPQQTRMAAAVQEALEQSRGLAVEAGTGVGKSLAYLIPGALWAAQGGRRLLVATHTRTLQEQLLERELPIAARVLARSGQPLRYAVLMGASNYLCSRRLERLLKTPELVGNSSWAVLNELAAWAKTAKTALRSQLPCLVPPGLWRRICRDPDLCPKKGRLCGGCLWRQDLERAAQAHVVVVNHALWLSSSRLPPYDGLILDEAHALADAAASHFGATLSPGSLLHLAEEARIFSPRASDRLAEEALPFFSALALRCGFREQALEPGGKLLDEPFEEVEPPSLAELEKSLAKAAELGADSDEADEAKALAERTASLRQVLRGLLQERSLDMARWLEWFPLASGVGFGFSLHVAPLDVSGLLAEKLSEKRIGVVMTSATLSSGQGLSDFKARVGFQSAHELVLDSPFDYRSQAGLLILDDLPEPSEDEAYCVQVADRCRRIIARVPGGVFILFSSWKMLRKVHELLRRKIRRRPLWVQGTGGNEALLEDFIAAKNAVLLGVDTFWQGVDVPGAALSAVIVAKLPFPNFTSPVEAARRRWLESLGRSYFEDWSLPCAVMKLRQGFGRLIRTAEDRGVVVILDPRVVRKPYGKAFLAALPACRRLRSIEEI